MNETRLIEFLIGRSALLLISFSSASFCTMNMMNTLFRLINNPCQTAIPAKQGIGHTTASNLDLLITGVQISTEEEGDNEENQQPPAESGIKCEVCCTENVNVDQLTQCTEGHLSCMTCAKKMAQERIGLMKSSLPCLSEESCNAYVHESEIRRFLDPIAFNLWLEIQLQDDLLHANMEDLENCPICHYAYFIDYSVPKTGTYTCMKCSKTTCRICKSIDHRPLRCNESSQWASSSSTDDGHKINEKMSMPLVRICPNSNCGTSIIKEEINGGCNKVTCTKCGTSMCYVCRKNLFGDAYDHFESASDYKGKKCPLYDDTASRHVQEVEKARFEADATSSDKDDLEYV